MELSRLEEFPLTLVLSGNPATSEGKITFHLETRRIDYIRLRLRREDNSPEAFMNTLKTGLIASRLFPEEAFRPARTPEEILIQLSNIAFLSGGPLFLIFSFFQKIGSPPILAAMERFIDHLPPGLHVLLVAASPPLPLAKYRARRKLFEITDF